jgi:hypothetical protein
MSTSLFSWFKITLMGRSYSSACVCVSLPSRKWKTVFIVEFCLLLFSFAQSGSGTDEE